MQTLLRFLALSLLLTSIADSDNSQTDMNAIIKTSVGKIVITLDPEKAPISVENFIQYVEDEFYTGTIFHRVIDGFVIQAGGMTADMSQKETRAHIHNESDNGLQNIRGSVALARTQDPNSATSQFFINLKDNFNLDYSAGKWGYTVFGTVTDGMDVVDKIAKSPVGTSGSHGDVPKEAIVIESVELEPIDTSVKEDVKSYLQKKARKVFKVKDPKFNIDS